jgi:hypothetical protein
VTETNKITDGCNRSDLWSFRVFCSCLSVKVCTSLEDSHLFYYQNNKHLYVKYEIGATIYRANEKMIEKKEKKRMNG